MGVSSHSLYKWVKAVTPDQTDKQAADLLEAKSEILRLRAQMRRVEEERDILKKPRGTLPGSPSEVPLHQRASTRVPNHNNVPSIARDPSRVLRVAAQADV